MNLGSNLIDPFYNKSVDDYDDNFEICVKTSNDANVNEKSKSTSKLGPFYTRS